MSGKGCLDQVLVLMQLDEKKRKQRLWNWKRRMVKYVEKNNGWCYMRMELMNNLLGVWGVNMMDAKHVGDDKGERVSILR